MNARFLMTLLCGFACVGFGCRPKYRDDLDYSYRVVQTWTLDDLAFESEIVQFESVFWEPDDTPSLRSMIVDDGIAAGRNVLEIGTGTGVLAILSMQNDAKSVIATDINPAAVACAKYNAAVLVPDQTIDVRRVLTSAPQAFSALGQSEKFDLIISNPPWEDGAIAKPADHAFYDPGFELMDSILDGLPSRLTPGGRCLLAYGNVPAIERLIAEAERRGIQSKILDDRKLDELETDFLPGMVIELRPPTSKSIVSGNRFVERDASKATDKSKATDESKGDDESKASDTSKANDTSDVPKTESDASKSKPTTEDASNPPADSERDDSTVPDTTSDKST